jgi:hypothetical protein
MTRVAPLASSLAILAGAFLLTACGGSDADPSTVALPSSVSLANSAATSAKVTSATTAPSVAIGSTSGVITLTGDFTGKMTTNLCSGSIMSVTVVVDGDSTKYLGSISAKSAGFIGPSGGTFVAISTFPTVSADGRTFTLDHVALYDPTLTKKTVTATGTLVCP